MDFFFLLLLKYMTLTLVAKKVTLLYIIHTHYKILLSLNLKFLINGIAFKKYNFKQLPV
jgi:hypothetical protein